MKLNGIHHITAITGDAPGNVDFYTRIMGLRMVKKSVNQDDPTVYHLFYGDEHAKPGLDLTFFEYPGVAPGRGLQGAGTVHHVAWYSSDEEHEAWRDRVRAIGGHPTPVIDRHYFRSVYFREPSGVLFELATPSPGFTVDEPLETLGEQLSIPPALEPRRAEIEAALKPLPYRRAARTRS
jgi:glyoxalase family protein